MVSALLHHVFLFLRTLHLQGVGRTDFSLWYCDIQRAAGGKGNALRDQQLSRNDIPIIVDSCISFITQYGEEEAPLLSALITAQLRLTVRWNVL